MIWLAHGSRMPCVSLAQLTPNKLFLNLKSCTWVHTVCAVLKSQGGGSLPYIW